MKWLRMRGLLSLGMAGMLVQCTGNGEPPHERRRQAMVERQIRARGVRDPRVLEALRRVPRHEFVPSHLVDRAYDDTALPIEHQQTISQPYVVAAMTEAADLQPGERVLEVGTGSGYQAAVLAELVAAVYSIEIVPELAERAGQTLEALGYENLQLRTGDGYRGWPEAAPFDAIIVTAAPSEVPPPLLEQLAPDGRLVIPVGDQHQTLRVFTRTDAGIDGKDLFDVRFVPMTGESQKQGQ